MSSSQNTSRTIQLVAGISLDGKITPPEGDFSDYSSKEDKAWLNKQIEESDVLVMGRKTYQQHVRHPKKSMIIFSRSFKGMKIEKSKQVIHWFNDSREDFLNLCDLLRYQRVTVLGGAEVYHWFLEQRLPTDIYVTVEPYLFGKGKHFLSGSLLSDKRPWKLKWSEQLNKEGTLLLHYQDF